MLAWCVSTNHPIMFRQKNSIDDCDRRHFKEMNLKSYRPAVRCTLTEYHKVRRLVCYEERVLWNFNQWWTNFNSLTNLIFTSSRIRKSKILLEKRINSSSSVHYRERQLQMQEFGAYTGKASLDLIEGNPTDQRYADQSLNPHVVPFIQRDRHTVQQDNARPHVEGV